jgi:peroxiredoxin Q/BCP
MAALAAVVVGISPQDVASHEAFTLNHQLNVPLLADVDKAVGKAYGVTAPLIGMRRAVFIVDEEGIVRYASVHALGLRYQTVDDIKAALDGIAPAAA